MIETVTLSNGVQMPKLGFGVFKLDTEEVCVNCVKHAIKSGYRLIDTAAMYRNEAWVGKAVKESGVPREELFVVTKLWLHQTSYEGAKIGFERSLKRLGLDYMDMYMIHWPYGEDVAGAWRALEELYEEGKVRAIGVCNFTPMYLEKLLETARIKPMVDQVECHPLLQRPELYEMLKREGIQMEAWSPVGRMNAHLMENPLLEELAQKYGKSKVQIILRWHYERGVIPIPKSATPSRIEENLKIFDFAFTPQEFAALTALDENYVTNSDPEKAEDLAELASRPAEF